MIFWYFVSVVLMLYIALWAVERSRYLKRQIKIKQALIDKLK